MPSFKVKAVYDYSSPHEDDLGFSTGQIITVTDEEDADWYIGEYVDESGTKQHGLFPKNFVEKYEPEPPPRPNRASRHKPLEAPAPTAVPPTPEIPQQEPAAVRTEEPEAPKPKVAPVDIPSTVKSPLSPISPPSATSTKAPEELQNAPPAPKPAPSAAAEKKAPPVAAKPSSFRDRIAAFNQASAAPIAPFKPAGAPATFIKKPFVAPPPSRNSYVPPPRETPQVKTYRREEDPEIAERQAQDQESAERAGLAGAATATGNDGDEDQPKPTSLKERIALLQKQQAEQAQRAAALHKEKPKKPPMKKRTESHQELREDGEGAALEKTASTESKERGSLDTARPPASRRISHLVKSPESNHSNREILSDANDADQSGAGDTVDSEGGSTSVEEDEDRSRVPAGAEYVPEAPVKASVADVGAESGEGDEEEEEDEMDAETRRKLELRERMAKMSGGMGMAGMFGGAGGLPMGLPPKKKKSGPEKKDSGDSEQHALPPRIPMIPIPGMSTFRSPEAEDTELAVQKEESTPHPITHGRDPEEVPDVEDVAPRPVQRTQTGDRGLPPPVPTERRPMPPPLATPNQTAPPPVPLASRPIPPASDRSSRSGSESGDELTEPASGQTITSPQPGPPSKRNSYFGSGEFSPDFPDRRIPPIPLGSPTMSPTIHARPPPPPPPTAAPPSRQPTMDNISKKRAGNEEETEYEGDYDTDIASGATHKDALKAHVREQSMDESITADEETPPAVRSPPVPPFPPTTRAAPPAPPHQPPHSGRPSVDAPRAAPPPPPMSPPAREPQEGDADYDPYRYTSPPRAVPPPPKGMPPPPSQPPPPQTRAPLPSMLAMPPLVPPQRVEQSSGDDEDDLYSSPPPRKSHDRPPPPPPSAPPHQQRPPPQSQDKPAPPPPQDRPAPPPPPQHTHSNYGIGRKSLDANRAMQGRVSMDQSRPSQSQEFIAGDVDLGASSHWWTQANVPPPSIQGRKDVLIEMHESRSGTSVQKAVYVLYLDYSQTIITADFDAHNVSDVQLEQRHEPPPTLHRQDQLEQAHETYGVRLAKDIEGRQNTVVGDGTPHAVVHELLRLYPGALKPISTRAFGALVYANLANASIQQNDMIRPGDIITFRNAKFQGKHGAMHAKYSMDVGKPDHVGVVVDWDGTKKKVRAWEQGRESKKVKVESFKMGDLRSGEVRVWRVMGREWVGWGNH